MKERTKELSSGGYGLTVGRVVAGGRELFIQLGADGSVTAYNGHVDLGTGIRTALAQIVAEELDVAFDRVAMRLGTVGIGPDQGATIASMTLQITAIPLRAAAAQARAALLTLASDELGVAIDGLRVEDGVVRPADNETNRFVSYATLLRDRRIHLDLDESTPVKPVDSYRVVGRSVSRVDIPAKATGALTYVQDMRVPGMLHGRVVRPPYAGIDHGAIVGHSLIGVDEASVADIPGLVAVVVVGDFVGVVAEREENATRAAERLVVSWRQGPRLPDMRDIPGALHDNPSTERVLLDRGDVEAALGTAARSFAETYVWPYHMHAAIGPSCSVADWQPEQLTVWSGTQNPHFLRDDLARLMDMPPQQVTVHRMETAGCYGRNCADDVGADAALLSRAVRRPVRVQLTRAQEHEWEPKGAAQLMEVRGGLDAAGNTVGYTLDTRYPSNRAPTLALILTGVASAVSAVGDVGDRTSIPPYDFPAMRIAVHDMATIARAAWLRGVSALPNTFAHESFVDELAAAAGVDPVEYRLRYLRDPRAIDVLNETVARAGWEPRRGARMRRDEHGILHGQGVAYALYVHSKFPGFGAAWAAWVAEVAVDPATGEVSVERVTVGQDAGLMINPDGVRHQLQGNVVQSISRVLKEQVTFDDTSVTSREWGAYPLLQFPDVPALQSVLLDRPQHPPMGAGESAAVPSAAAIANAIYDATGVRFREVPFTPERIRAGLERAGLSRADRAADRALPQALAAPTKQQTARLRRKGWIAALSGAAAGVATAAMTLLPASLPRVPRTDPALYSAATLARGRQLAAIGNCVTCHTATGGQPFAGGHRLDTPFGTIVTPNITPDEATGIGSWSYAAFARAMRQGIDREGRHLYPAFPYTAFTKIQEADMQALYAYMTNLAPVSAPRQANELRFPFNLRPLLAGWNAMFLRPGMAKPDPARSAAWNRGAYLVDGLGHCGACHNPRNALGAERGGRFYMAGGVAQEWESPALNGQSRAPLPWTEDDLFDYLRTGFSRFHGPAAGPMASVVAQMSTVPDDDVRAMAVYLASLTPTTATSASQQADATRIEAATAPGAADSVGARIYDGACAVCHQPGRLAVSFGVRPSLALNSAIHSDTPDTLIRTVLNGIAVPARPDLGAMPGFGAHLDDAQTAALLRYLRAQFAPGRPAWAELEPTIARLRPASASR